MASFLESLEDYRKEFSNAWKPWRKALSVQRQTLAALIFRETRTRFGEQSLGILWAFGEVMTHILVFWLLWTVMGRESHNGLSIPVFLASGMIPYFMFKQIFTKTSCCISGNQSLLVFSQIQILDFALARSIVEFIIYVSAMFYFFAILFFFKFEIPIDSMVKILWGIINIALLGLSAGLVYLPFKDKFKIIDTVVDVSFRFLYFISGVVFPLDKVPHWAMEYLAYNPILHIVEFIRSGFIADYGHYTDISYSINCILFLLMIGLIFLKRLRKMILDND